MTLIKELFTTQFYKYWYYKIGREKLWEYLFFNWSIFLCLVIIFFAGIFAWFPGKILFVLPKTNDQVYILESILRSISLFVGILFSFIILSFNVFNRYFGRYAFLGFSKNKSAKTCLTLLVCTIALLIYSSSYIRNIKAVDAFDKFIYLFSISLSVVSFFSIFPCLLILLVNSQSRENIRSLFKGIDRNWAINQHLANDIDESSYEFYHKDPLSILNEVGLVSIKEFDNRTLSAITSSCVSSFEKNSKELQDGRPVVENAKLYNEFGKLLSNLFQLSTKERNAAASMMLLRARFELENIVLNNLKEKGFEDFSRDHGAYRHWEIDFNTTSLFKKAIQFNEDDVCERIINEYMDFIVLSIPKLFPEKFEYVRENHFNAVKESYMVFEPLRVINELSEILISNKNLGIFESIVTAYFVIEEKVIELNVSNEAKCFLLNVINNYKYDVFERYVNSSDGLRISYAIYPFKHNAYTFKKTNCAVTYLSSLQSMDLLFTKGRLNAFVINMQKADMLGLIGFVPQKESYKNLVFKSVDKFIEISKKILPSDNDYRKNIYLKLEEYLGFVLHTAQNTDSIDSSVIDKLNAALASFNYKKQFEDELAAKGYIGDDRMM
ncbi:MAG: hypothetical protein EOO61_02210 [Hymenobacter sp.]|nr:MAG: hypothetical protein EOO61_02210 [Hymenobacter sp.]